MNDKLETETVFINALTDDELAVVVGGSDGPGSPGDGTGAR